MDEPAARETLARIEAHVGHLATESGETRRSVGHLRKDVEALKVESARGSERIEGAVRAVDARVERHEEDDTRRFASVHGRLDRLRGYDEDGRVKKIAKGGGLVVGGGGAMLVLLELLKLLGSKAG